MVGSVTNVWIGTRPAFQWLDGSPFNYINYASGEPSGPGTYGNLLGGWANMLWDDAISSEAAYSMCKYNPSGNLRIKYPLVNLLIKNEPFHVV